MAASVLNISSRSPTALRARRSARKSPPAPAVPGLSHGLTSRLHVWLGTSGKRHMFSVYGLLECPSLPPAAYVLVYRDAEGRRTLLECGTVEQTHAPFNLATLRHRGATAGANEVHVCFATTSPRERSEIAADLDDTTTADPQAATAH